MWKFAILVMPLAQGWACSCIGPGTPSSAAGRSAAVFTGTVLSIDNPAPVPVARQEPTGRMPVTGRPMQPWPNRTIRLRVGETLSGVPMGQAEIEILTGMGDGDCGFPFEAGKEFFVYADRDPEGRLRTSICARTRPLEKAAEDLAYLRATAGTPETSRLLVHTGYPGFPARPGVQIAAEALGKRHLALTNAAGDVLFDNLPPGAYRVHSVADGDLPDDPQFQLGARGSQEITLFRTLKIRGRITTRQGQPPTGTDIELRSETGDPSETAGIGPDGAFEIRLRRPGRYYLGVNLNRPATADSPYPRWFHPGTEDTGGATVIEFSGTPGVRTYDMTLPDPKPVRVVEGTTLLAAGTTAKFVRLFAFDLQGHLIAETTADPDGRFRLSLPADGSYRLHAVWPGNHPGDAISAVPAAIEPGLAAANLRIKLTQPGNSYLEMVSQAAKPKP